MLQNYRRSEVRSEKQLLRDMKKINMLLLEEKHYFPEKHNREDS